MPLVEERRASSVDEAVSAADELGYPVVLKAEAASLVHKSDEGAVEVGLESADQLRAAADQMQARLSDHAEVSYLIQRQVVGGVELLVGATEIPGLGHSVAFGLGGVFVEVMRDVQFGLAPLSPAESERLIRSIKGAPILAGARGRAPVDLEALVELLERVGRLVTDHPSISELDLNPVIATAEGVVAVDARLRARQQ